jgi:hypothetical protein
VKQFERALFCAFSERGPVSPTRYSPTTLSCLKFSFKLRDPLLKKLIFHPNGGHFRLMAIKNHHKIINLRIHFTHHLMSFVDRGPSLFNAEQASIDINDHFFNLTKTAFQLIYSRIKFVETHPQTLPAFSGSHRQLAGFDPTYPYAKTLYHPPIIAANGAK